MKAIIIRYGEIFLKGNNRNFFERCLRNNIVNALDGIIYNFVRSSARFYIEDYDEAEENIIIDKLTKVFGIHSISAAIKIDTDIDCIIATALSISPKNGTFKVLVNRADKRFIIGSMEFAARIGAEILQSNDSLRVNLHNPDNEVNIDIRENGSTYLYSKKVPGQDGMPVGSSGRGLLLLSGGIDSPVAAYMMAKRGMIINAIHFHSYPYTSDKAKQKVLNLAQIVSKYSGKMQINIISLTEIQQEIHKKVRGDYMITLVRRFMLRIAETIANRTKSDILVTGESLGQVASQTVESINTISQVTDMQILRPLIGFDKTDIIDIAKKISTFETSIEPYEDCCTVFLPKNPVIKPTVSACEQAEESLDIDNLIQRALDTLEIVKIFSKL